MLSDFLRSEDLCFTLQHEFAPRINITDFEVMYSDGGRPLGLVGPTLGGCLLQVAFVMREGHVRVISARIAHWRRLG